MRSLAEFAMRSRATALLVAVLSTGTSLFFWVGAAVVALVTLRKGTSEGLILLLWSLLPAGAVLYLLAEVLPVANLIAAFLLAWVLRNTISLATTLIMAPVTGLFRGNFADHCVTLSRLSCANYGRACDTVASGSPGRHGRSDGNHGSRS